MTKLKKINKKKFFYSFVQGRFSSEVAGKFQHFPIHNWENEFNIAKKFNFDSIEWIITDFSNPIFNQSFSKIIKNVLKKNKMKISSISMDIIMDNALHKLSLKETRWLSEYLLKAIKYFDIKRVSIPIEERSRFNNAFEKKLALNNLNFIYQKLNNHCKICIETDLSPASLIEIFKLKKFKKLGLLLDLGNTRAHGFKVEDYFNLYCDKIYSIHIKYRDKSYGKTKIINEKSFHELEYVINNLKKLNNLVDISFQTFKTDKNFLANMKKSIKSFNNYVK